MDSIEHLIQAYGFLGAFFVLVCYASFYVLRRCLNKKDGILTLVAKKHIIFIDKTMETMDHITKTQDKICAIISARFARVGGEEREDE